MLACIRGKDGKIPSKTLNWRHFSNGTITRERYRIQLLRWAKCWVKINQNTNHGAKSLICIIKTLGLTLLNPLKPTWKRLNGNFYTIRHIPQIFWSSLVPFDGTWSSWLVVSLIRRHNKVALRVKSFKRRIFLPYFKVVICIHFFHIILN